VDGPESPHTVVLPLPDLLPQAVVSKARLVAAPVVFAALAQSPSHRIALATGWGFGEGTVGAAAIARADDTPPPPTAAPAVSPPLPPASPRLQALGEQLGGGDTAALDAFWRQVAKEETPLIEPTTDTEEDVLVTFLWRAVDPVERVVVVRGLAGDNARRHQMTRLGDTDLWYRTYRSRADARFTYLLSPNDSLMDPADLGDDPAAWQARAATFRVDPLNRRPFPDDPLVAPVASSVTLPGAPAQPWLLDRPGIPRGRLEARRVRSRLLDNERDVFIYTPPGYDGDGAPCDVLLLFDGWAYLDYVPTPTILDNLLAEGRIPPTVAVIVDYPTVEGRNEELPCNPRFADFLAQELLPWVGPTYHVTADPARTVVAGSSYGGLAAAYAAFRHPERIGNVLALSGSFWWGPGGPAEPEWLTRQFVERSLLPIRFFLEVGLLEGPEYGTPDQLAANRHLRDVLRARGYRVRYQEFNGGHDYLCWRGALAYGLVALLGDC
jgi:enterochelin esterase-like enzyme